VDWRLLVLGVILVVLFYAVFVLWVAKENCDQQLAFYKNQSLLWELRYNESKAQLLEQRNRIQELASNLSQLQQQYQELSQNYSQLQLQYQELEKEYKELEGEYNASLEVSEELLMMLERVYLNLSTYMEWFKANSRVSEIPPDMRECLQGFKLNIACLNMMLNNQGIEYKDEGDADRLQSLNETLKYGGDCEDWTLLINAYIRTFNPKYISLWKNASPWDEYIVYEDDRYIWYYTEAEEVLVPYTKVYGVCYGVDEWSGHCVSLVSNQEPPYFTSGTLFEPQTGEYLGELGEALKICKEGTACDENYYIYIIFGEDNFYLFQDGKWVDYKTLQKMLEPYLN